MTEILTVEGQTSELGRIANQFNTAQNSVRTLIITERAKAKMARDKLAVYKKQQSLLVKNHRLLRLEYKELKRNYDKTLGLSAKAATVADNAELAERNERQKQTIEAHQEREKGYNLRIAMLQNAINTLARQKSELASSIGNDDVVYGSSAGNG